jgi:energy-coupling factor transport system substrate-specific component
LFVFSSGSFETFGELTIMLNSIKKDFSMTTTLALIPVAVALNLALGTIAERLALPIFLDSIGTVLVAILCGPWAGAVAGILTNVVGGIIVSPGFLPFTPVAAIIGLVAGFLANAGWFRTLPKAALSGVIITLAVVVVATPTRLLVFGGYTANSLGAITGLLVASGQDIVTSVFSVTILSNIVDKVATALIAFGIARALPMRLLSRFPRPENVIAKSTQPVTTEPAGA